MNTQKSYNSENDLGVLYLVGTPIGNLDDMTYRAVKILRQVDLIAAEDTRHTIKLLNHFDIQKRLVSYHEHNKDSSGKELIKRLEEGTNIALVSDAGMPAISDPGNELVNEAVSRGISVIPIPGANAAISGLVASGLSTRKFVFLGFLPREKKSITKELERIKDYTETLVFYEAPHRIKKTLKVITEVLGNRKAVLIRELTKKHEEFIRGTIEEILKYIEFNPLKGEMTLVIEGISESQKKGPESWWIALTINEHVEYYIKDGKTSKEAIKLTAKDRNLPKRDVYKIYHGY
ncbi:16S rRNA (cytidine(1402)-2'-O)-methyltransferase [Vulcanibacillus modesticaldus]|uniref:Ribosomal RNA small subunit methyltransferase I n=1 Tax=Vulcanibacillus modesticaldus TaxID=337097 RepID=A0A1D2YXA9_9BACI|nr:16S rRNA (cytidine(1402)-2'-O)-methyltransferase [Vulcanibacillus modesticaldus]OEG00280.1 16S rRNA (cytidine(1402)-2'-O)-methyltransferase [Vulcanibacillus modesticaldus]